MGPGRRGSGGGRGGDGSGPAPAGAGQRSGAAGDGCRAGAGWALLGPDAGGGGTGHGCVFSWRAARGAQAGWAVYLSFGPNFFSECQPLALGEGTLIFFHKIFLESPGCDTRGRGLFHECHRSGTRYRPQFLKSKPVVVFLIKPCFVHVLLAGDQNASH